MLKNTFKDRHDDNHLDEGGINDAEFAINKVKTHSEGFPYFYGANKHINNEVFMDTCNNTKDIFTPLKNTSTAKNTINSGNNQDDAKSGFPDSRLDDASEGDDINNDISRILKCYHKSNNNDVRVKKNDDVSTGYITGAFVSTESRYVAVNDMHIYKNTQNVGNESDKNNNKNTFSKLIGKVAGDASNTDMIKQHVQHVNELASAFSNINDSTKIFEKNNIKGNNEPTESCVTSESQNENNTLTCNSKLSNGFYTSNEAALVDNNFAEEAPFGVNENTGQSDGVDEMMTKQFGTMMGKVESGSCVELCSSFSNDFSIIGSQDADIDRAVNGNIENAKYQQLLTQLQHNIWKKSPPQPQHSPFTRAQAYEQYGYVQDQFLLHQYLNQELNEANLDLLTNMNFAYSHMNNSKYKSENEFNVGNTQIKATTSDISPVYVASTYDNKPTQPSSVSSDQTFKTAVLPNNPSSTNDTPSKTPSQNSLMDIGSETYDYEVLNDLTFLNCPQTYHNYEAADLYNEYHLANNLNNRNFVIGANYLNDASIMNKFEMNDELNFSKSNQNAEENGQFCLHGDGEWHNDCKKPDGIDAKAQRLTPMELDKADDHRMSEKI